MIGSKAGAAGLKRSCGQNTKRKRDTKRDRWGVAGISDSGGGGSGVSGELDGVEGVKFFGVRDSSTIVEVKNYAKGHHFYTTVKEGKLVAATICDVARVFADPSYPETGLNILKVGHCIQKEARIEAQIEHSSIGKSFLVEFTKRHPLKLDDLPDEQFPLKLEGLTKEQFAVLREKIIHLSRQCFLELKKEITGDREHYFQGRQRKDLGIIHPYLAEDGVTQEDDRAQALKDEVTKVVAEFAPSNGKLLDAKGEAEKSSWITFLKNQLQKLEPAQNQREDPEDLAGLKDGELFMNPFVPQL